MESTPQALIDLIVSCGKTIDQRFPRLRETNVEEWAKKVAALGHSMDSRFGRKSAHGMTGGISVDTFAIKLNPHEIEGRIPFYGVSIIRHNPPTNEWRPNPHDYGLIETQYWITPEDADVGGVDPDEAPPYNPSPDNEVVHLLKSINSQIASLSTRFEELLIRVSQIKDAINTSGDKIAKEIKDKKITLW